jgi:hypothetical protein
MRWAILLGSPDISGGTYVIFEHAIRAQKKGIEVTIVTEEKVPMERLHWHPEARSIIWKTFSEVSNETFDICIATWWRTVYEMTRVAASTYAYFVQSIESRFYDESEKPLRKLVESTYRLPLYIITEATWIQRYLSDVHNAESYLVRNGIRKDIYSITGETIAPREPGKLRVLVEGPIDVGFKNVPKTIKLCRRSNADEIWLLTSSPIDSYNGVDRVFSRVPIFDTAKIYRSCDVIVKLSYVEGMFGPPLEMFHCGGTSITYNVTGHDEYIIADVNGLVAQTDDEEQVVNYINMLKENPERLARLKASALKTAEQWPSWDQSSSDFIAAIQDIYENRQKISQDVLRNNSEFYFDWYVIGENYKNELAGRKSIYRVIYQKLNNYLRIKHPRVHQFARKVKFRILERKN